MPVLTPTIQEGLRTRLNKCNRHVVHVHVCVKYMVVEGLITINAVATVF